MKLPISISDNEDIRSRKRVRRSLSHNNRALRKFADSPLPHSPFALPVHLMRALKSLSHGRTYDCMKQNQLRSNKAQDKAKTTTHLGNWLMGYIVILVGN